MCICYNVSCRFFYKWFIILCGCKIFPEPVGDNTADLILYLENIGDIAIIIFTPDMITISSIDELCSNTYTVTRFAYTAFKYFVNIQLNSDIAYIIILSFECKRRSARCYL